MKNLDWLSIIFWYVASLLKFRKRIADCYVHMFVHTNRCFCDAFASANIWLYHVLHDNLHCLVFKEHPWFSLEAFEKLFRESASIWYLSAFALSRTFLKFFFRSSHASLVSSLSAVLCSRCLPPTWYIIHASFLSVNTFLKKFFRFFSMYTKSRHADAWRLIFHGGGTEIWTPDTAGMNRML